MTSVDSIPLGNRFATLRRACGVISRKMTNALSRYSQLTRSRCSCIETSASHPFLFLGGKDGSVDVFDVDRGVMASHARIPNLWLAQEELLRRSGVLDAPSRRHMWAAIEYGR